MPSDPTSREYRDSVGMFTTGITVVTATSGRFGHGMTANAFASVSLDPLLVLVCVVRDALMHKVLDEVGRFAVSVLAGHPGPVTGAPLLDGALAHLECDVEAAYPGGDHTVFLGRVRWVERARADGDPLLYFGGHYRRLGSS